jgi:hypothetical protein
MHLPERLPEIDDELVERQPFFGMKVRVEDRVR